MYREIVGGVEREVRGAPVEDCDECAGFWSHGRRCGVVI